MNYNFIGKLDLLFKKKNDEIKKLKALLDKKDKETSELKAEIERLKSELDKMLEINETLLTKKIR